MNPAADFCQLKMDMVKFSKTTIQFLPGFNTGCVIINFSDYPPLTELLKGPLQLKDGCLAHYRSSNNSNKVMLNKAAIL